MYRCDKLHGGAAKAGVGGMTWKRWCQKLELGIGMLDLQIAEHGKQTSSEHNHKLTNEEN